MTKFNECEILYLKNNFNDCIESINKFIINNEKGKADLNYIFRFAIKGMKYGETNSKKILQQIAKSGPPPWLASIYKAAIHFETGQFKEAIDELNEADIHDNNSIHKSIIQCQCFSKMKQYEDATTAFKEATSKLNKYNSKTCVSLKHFEAFTTEWVLDYAQALLESRQYHDALNAVNTLANLQYKQGTIDVAKGTSLFGLCKYKEACKAYLAAGERLKNTRFFVFINFQIAKILMMHGDFEAAKKSFARTIELNKLRKVFNNKQTMQMEENIAVLDAAKKIDKSKTFFDRPIN